jgi:repressor LexA
MQSLQMRLNGGRMILTKKQTEALRFIRQYIKIHGISPTAKEIAAGIGIQSTGVVHRYVKALAQARCINLVPNRRRNIQLSQESGHRSARQSCTLPMLGAIAAGPPIEANADMLDDEDSHLDLTQIMGPNRFALQIKGESMIGDNICDGDYVICESCSSAANGAIVVVLIDREEVTLKRMQRNTCGTVSLIPSNPRMDAMVLSEERVAIQGRYLGLLRI